MQSTFRFMDLPAEMRELVYLYAFAPFKPLDTAAIPNTPERVLIHPIAQLSAQTRKEALYVFFKSRPVEVSLHSDENLRRALIWAERCNDQTAALPRLIFSGRLTNFDYHFFEITLETSDEVPFCRASAKKFASVKANKAAAIVKKDMLAWLASRLQGGKEGRAAKLGGRALSDLILVVANAAKDISREDVELSTRKASPAGGDSLITSPLSVQ